MESSQEDILETGVVYTVPNQRRVLTSLRKFTDGTSQLSMLLGGDSLYGANVMDGKLKTFTMQDLSASRNQ
jgi:hypothetical protein